MKEMDESKFITPSEMTAIGSLCQLLDTTWKFIENTKGITTDIFDDEAGYARTFKVFDSNGECVGRIGFSEEGFALYLDTSDGAGDF